MTTPISVESLSGIPLTLLYPMYARALETQRPDALAKDPEAVEMQKRISFDFSLFDRIANNKTLTITGKDSAVVSAF